MKRLISVYLFISIVAFLNAQAIIPAPTMVSISGGSYFRIEMFSKQEVQVAGFLIANTETTQALYEAIMAYNPSWFKGPDRPVEKVSWYDAVTFCNRLSIREGLEPAYIIDGTKVSWNKQSTGYRLPTEAEWEIAAYGGPNAPITKYAGGENIADVAWYDRNAHDVGRRSIDYGTHQVATKTANRLGLYDMSGNVWEWCQDWYAPYPQGPLVNPSGPGTGAGRVSKGGSWYHTKWEATIATRYADGPYLSYAFQGFRVARSLAVSK